MRTDPTAASTRHPVRHSRPAAWLEPSIHPTYFRLLVTLMRSAQVDADALLASIGLTWAELRRQERLLSFGHWHDLVVRGIRQMERPGLGLLIGAAAHASAHGPVGYAAMSSRDLRETMETLVKFAGLRTQVLDAELTQDRKWAELAVRERFSLGDARISVLEMILVIVVRLLEAAAGRPLPRATYLLPYPEPAWSAEYSALLAGKLQFGAERLAIRLPLDELDAPCVTADAAAHALACRECRIEQASTRVELSQRLRRWLRECDGEFPTLAAIAQRCHCSPRTLIRRLKREQSSYRALLDEVRREAAVRYLQTSELPIELIAARIGCADTSNFSRTFRRWFGTTPREFRERASAQRLRE